MSKNKDWLEERQSLLERTNRITQELKEMGFVVVEMWECDFRNYCKANPAIYPLIERQRPDFHRKHKSNGNRKANSRGSSERRAI